MKSYLTSVFFFLLLLISCGGSKTNLNDSLLTGAGNQNTTTTQVSTNNQGNTSTIQTPSYSFGNELVWSDEFVEDSSFQLQETLAENIAELVKRDFGVKSIKLRVSKPGALRGAKDVGLIIHR